MNSIATSAILLTPCQAPAGFRYSGRDVTPALEINWTLAVVAAGADVFSAWPSLPTRASVLALRTAPCFRASLAATLASWRSFLRRRFASESVAPGSSLPSTVTSVSLSHSRTFSCNSCEGVKKRNPPVFFVASDQTIRPSLSSLQPSPTDTAKRTCSPRTGAMDWKLHPSSHKFNRMLPLSGPNSAYNNWSVRFLTNRRLSGSISLPFRVFTARRVGKHLVRRKIRLLYPLGGLPGLPAVTPREAPI